jgi:MFS family permease
VTDQRRGNERASSVPTNDGVWSRERRRLTLGLVLTITLVAFESLAISTVMPVVSKDLGGLGLYGWVFSGFFLGSLFGIVAAGQEADRRGPVPPFMSGLALFALGLLGGGLAPSMPVLVAARCVQGVGAGAIPAIAYVSVGRAYPQPLQPQIFAVFSTAWVVPGIVGPATSSAIAAHLGWRFVFLGLLPLVVLAAAMTLPPLRRLGPPAGGEPAVDRRREAIAVTAGAALVLGGLSSGSFVLGPLLALPGFVLGARAFVRLVPTGTLRIRTGLPAAIAVRGILTFAFFGADAYVSLALTDVRDKSTSFAAIALTVGTLTWTTGAWVQARLIGRHGPRPFVMTGFLFVATANVLLTLTLLDSFPASTGIIAWAVAGLGMGLAYAPLSLTVLAAAPAGQEGSATAALQLSDVLGVALGTGLSGAIVSIGASWPHAPRGALLIALPIMAGVAVAGHAAARRLPARLPASREL